MFLQMIFRLYFFWWMFVYISPDECPSMFFQINVRLYFCRWMFVYVSPDECIYKYIKYKIRINAPTDLSLYIYCKAAFIYIVAFRYHELNLVQISILTPPPFHPPSFLLTSPPSPPFFNNFLTKRTWSSSIDIFLFY